MHTALRLLLPVTGSVLVTAALAGGPVSWQFAAAPAGQDTLEVRLSATCEAGWHIYALSLPSDEGPLPTVIELQEGTAFRPAGTPQEPEPIEEHDPNFGMLVRYHGGTVTFVQPMQRHAPGPQQLHGSVEYMACNDKTCLPPRTVEFTLSIPAR